MAFAFESDVIPAVRIGAAVLAVFLVFHFLVYPTLLSPLSQLPSAHWSSPFSPAWILHVRFQRRENSVLSAAHRRLGPIVRVGPNDVSIDDVDFVRTVYGGGFEKTKWYSVFDNYGVPCMFSTGSAREHSLRKRILSHVYSKSYVQSSESANAQARVIIFDRLLPLLTHSASASQAPHGIDVHSTFLAATMDFISAYAYGIWSSTNFLQNKAYRDHWLQLYMSRHGYPFFPQELPRLTWFLRKLGVPPYPQWVDAANQEMRDWNENMCKRAMETDGSKKGERWGPEDNPVVLRTLLAGLQKEKAVDGEESLSHSTAILQQDSSVNSELFDHILAGQETAGVTLTYLTWQLSKDIPLQQKLRKELLTLKPGMAVGGGAIPDPKALDALPTLHAVITETLRLHAALPGPLPRQTPYPSCRIGPYKIPGGVRIAALAHTLHRDESVFQEPETFNHERWLEDGVDEEARKERHRHFWAFSSGGRMCIGSHFAMHEMKLVVAAIYTNFTTHIVDDVGMEQTDGYTGRPASERLYLRFEAVP